MGAKFYYIGGPWRAYLSHRYNDIHSGFSFFISYTLASNSGMTMIVLYVHIMHGTLLQVLQV